MGVPGSARQPQAVVRRRRADRSAGRETEIASAEVWPRACDELLVAENEATRTLEQIETYKERMGRTMPFGSSHGTSCPDDCDGSCGVLLSVLLRDGGDVHRTRTTYPRATGHFGRPRAWNVARRKDEYTLC